MNEDRPNLDEIKYVLNELKDAIQETRVDKEKLSALQAQLKELATYQKITSKNLAKVTENLEVIAKDMVKITTFENELEYIKKRIIILEEHKDKVTAFLVKAFATLIIAGAMYGFILSKLK